MFLDVFLMIFRIWFIQFFEGRGERGRERGEGGGGGRGRGGEGEGWEGVFWSVAIIFILFLGKRFLVILVL